MLKMEVHLVQSWNRFTCSPASLNLHLFTSRSSRSKKKRRWPPGHWFFTGMTPIEKSFFFRKLALVGIIPNQTFFSFSSDKDRRTDSRIRQKNTARCGFVAQWLERATRIRKTVGSIPGGAALCFFVWSGCQFFYLCRSWKRREFEYLLLLFWNRDMF